MASRRNNNVDSSDADAMDDPLNLWPGIHQDLHGFGQHLLSALTRAARHQEAGTGLPGPATGPQAGLSTIPANAAGVRQNHNPHNHRQQSARSTQTARAATTRPSSGFDAIPQSQIQGLSLTCCTTNQNSATVLTLAQDRRATTTSLSCSETGRPGTIHLERLVAVATRIVAEAKVPHISLGVLC